MNPSDSLAIAPIDDEPETDSERVSVEEARQWLHDNDWHGIPHTEAMRRLGLS
jgi:hypothetical protein